MARLVTVLVAAMLLAVASARDFPRHHQLDQYTFKRWVSDANRQYTEGSAEWIKREKIFNTRLADIKRHNGDLSKTWKRGVNQFSDFTQEEWASYNRAAPNYEPTLKGFETRLMEPAKNKGDLPAFVDYRDRTNPPILTGIKNQGSCGSCWAHSATESMESFFALRFGQLPVLSVQQITSCTLSMNGCGGGSYVAAWEAVQQFGGLNEEWTYPYTDFFAPEMAWKYTSKCQNITKKFPVINTGSSSFTFTWWPKANVTGWTRVPRNNAQAAMEALALHGPLATSVASDTWGDYESGVLQNNYSSWQSNVSWQQINHDVQMVGYGFDFDLNVNYWIIRNSWGTNYGEQGYIRLLRPEHEPCGNATGWYVCGTSAVLDNLGFPEVKPLEKQNGYYF